MIKIISTDRSRIERTTSAACPAAARMTPGVLTAIVVALLSTCLSGWSLAAPVQATAASNAHSAREIATNLTGFSVPFQINADDSRFIEVQLYVSRDQGRSWQFTGRQNTDNKEFPFQAGGDGEYWFALKTLSRDRKLLPAGAAQPELKITVDTVRPDLSANVKTDAGGRVVCEWDVRDENIDPASLKIFYQGAVEGGPDDDMVDEWEEIPFQITHPVANGIFADSIAWWPDTTERALNVRIECADRAGNIVTARRQVVVPQVSWRHRSSSTVQRGDTLNPGRTGLESPRGYPASTYPAIADAEANGAAAGGTQPVPQTPPNMVCDNGVCHPVGPTLDSSPPALRVATRPRIGSPVEPVAPPVPASLRIARQSPGQQLPVQSFPALQQVQRPPLNANNGLPNANNGQPNSGTALAPSIAWEGTVQPSPVARNSAVGSTLSNTEIAGPGSRPVSQFDRDRDSGLHGGTYHSNGSANDLNASQRLPGRDIGNGMFVAESTARRGLTGGSTGDSTGNSASASGQSFQESSRQLAGEPQGFRPLPRQHESPQQQNSNAVPVAGPSPNYVNPNLAVPGPPGLNTNPNPRQPLTAPAALGVRPPESEILPVNTKRFRLNYSIDAIDPSGVKRVDLWVTRDGGQTWQAWGEDPDGESPFPVEVEGSGLYAFRIAVHSRDGLTGRAPVRGDKPDMWVDVDVDAPRVRITSVPYGRGQDAGRLVINWQADDPNMTLRPVNLKYAIHPEGPWTEIATGLRNSGSYLWKPTADVPERLILRIEARDNAGNVGVFQLNAPLDVSGLIPRGHINGIEPVGG